MAFSPRLFAAAAAGAALMTAPAFADSTAEYTDLCIAQFETDTAAHFEDTTFKFKGVRGSSAKKIYFKATLDGETDTVVCKVRRGEITEIVWPAVVEAKLSLTKVAEVE